MPDNPLILTANPFGHIVLEGGTVYDKYTTGNPVVTELVLSHLEGSNIYGDFAVPVDTRTLLSAVWQGTLITAPAAGKPVLLAVYDGDTHGTFATGNPELLFYEIGKEGLGFDEITSDDAPGVIAKPLTGDALDFLRTALTTGMTVVFGGYAIQACPISKTELSRAAGFTLTLTFDTPEPRNVYRRRMLEG